MASPAVLPFKGQARLPKFAVPRRYDLTLKPDLAACVFSGAVDVHLDVVEATRCLVLNAIDLEIDSGSVFFRTADPQPRDLRPKEVILEEEDEILVLVFDENLPLRSGVLGIRFSGVLNDHMRGFYRSTFVVDGIKRNMAVTQFEAVDARRCFPCWDEPALKASFQITLEVPCDLMALSNMPVTKEIIEGQLKTVYFEMSPTMSTYLVAIVVGLFDCIEDSTLDGIKVRVYCPIGKSDQGKFGLHIALRSLELFKIYFSVPYALPKLDLVVIPDFSGGAMENYGLITFRDTALLYDEHYSAAANKQSITISVAHEVAHQWFGNLVTMEWWTHLWLNEGFATWVSYLATDALFPEWKIWTQFLEQTAGGLKLDALRESHPIEVEVTHARAIDEIFDAISYKKGSAVIRMLQAYIGYDVFQKSLTSYIKRYACQNAQTEDLWDVLSEESGAPVKAMMETWTKRKGYPVIYIKSNGCMLEFEQSQFISGDSLGDTRWIVPVTLCLGSYEIQKSFLLESKVHKLDISEFLYRLGGSGPIQDISDETCDRKHFWVKVNVEQTGFYRVKYDDILATKLWAAIEANSLSTTDRYGVLDDAFSLCEACIMPLSSLLSLMDVYRAELDYIVLSRLISIILRIMKLATYAVPKSLDKLKQYFISLLQLSAEKLGWDHCSGESHLNGLLRGEIWTALAILGHDITCIEATRRFNIFLKNRAMPLLPPDIRKATYTAVMQNVTTTNRYGLESLLKVYRETDIGQEKLRVLNAMASCPDPNIVLETLDFLLSSEVRNQDVIYALAAISSEGSEIAWSWLKANWEHISDRWGHHILLTHFIRDIVTQFFTDEKANEIEEFFQSRTKTSITRTVKQSMEHVRINAKWASYIESEQNLDELIVKLSQKTVL